MRLVAVTKSVDTATAAALLALGVADLGESRVQALARRREEWPSGVDLPRWHLLGHLQRNKARAALRLAEEIHSLDSLRLCEALDEAASAEGRRPAVWIELDLTGDEQRTGLSRFELPSLIERAARSPHLRLQGLMTLAPAPLGDGRDAARASEVFGELARLAAATDPAPFEGARVRLSMGMSTDFELAIEQGADVVRVGSALFSGVATAGGRA